MGPLCTEQPLGWRNFPCNISLNVISSADMSFFFLPFLVVGEIVSLIVRAEASATHTQPHTHRCSEKTQSGLHRVGIHRETGLSIIAPAAYQALLPASDKQAPRAQFMLRWSGLICRSVRILSMAFTAPSESR